MIFPDPGPCPVDDTPHTACTPESVAAQQGITVPILRAAATDPACAPIVVAGPRADVVPRPPLKAEILQATLPPDHYTTGTYRGEARRRGRRR